MEFRNWGSADRARFRSGVAQFSRAPKRSLWFDLNKLVFSSGFRFLSLAGVVVVFLLFSGHYLFFGRPVIKHDVGHFVAVRLSTVGVSPPVKMRTSLLSGGKEAIVSSPGSVASLPATESKPVFYSPVEGMSSGSTVADKPVSGGVVRPLPVVVSNGSLSMAEKKSDQVFDPTAVSSSVLASIGMSSRSFR